MADAHTVSFVILDIFGPCTTLDMEELSNRWVVEFDCNNRAGVILLEKSDYKFVTGF